MTLQEIEVFLNVVHTGSISAAAQAMYITQPAVSRQLHALERELDCVLLERRRGQRQIELTQRGRDFVQAAEKLRQAWQEAIEVAHTDRQRTLNLASVGSVCAYLLPKVFRSFLEEDATRGLIFHNYHSSESYDYVAQGEIDLAMIAEDKYHPQVETIPLFREPMVLVAGRESGFSGVVHPTQLDPSKELRLPWNPEYDMWHSFWFRSGVQPRAELDQMSLLEELFTWQDGWSDSWAITPVLVAQALADKTDARIHPLKDGPPDEIIYYLQGRKRKPELTREFLQCLDGELRRHPEIESYLSQER